MRSPSPMIYKHLNKLLNQRDRKRDISMRYCEYGKSCIKWATSCAVCLQERDGLLKKLFRIFLRFVHILFYFIFLSFTGFSFNLFLFFIIHYISFFPLFILYISDIWVILTIVLGKVIFENQTARISVSVKRI